MNLQKKLHRLAVAALAMAMVGAVYFSYTWDRQQAIRHLQESADSRLKHFSLSVFAHRDKYAYLPSLVANYPVVVEAFRHPHDKRRARRANELLEQLNAETGTAVIYLMTLQGLTLASSNWREPVSFIGNNYAFRPYFLEALRTGKGSFYGLGVTSRMPGYYVARLVRLHGAPLGVVVVKVDIHDIPVEWTREDSEVVVTDENGVIFLSSRNGWKYHPIQPLSPEAQERLRRTHQYDGVLQAPLPIEVREELSADEKIIRIERASGKRAKKDSYFIKSRRLPASDWTIHVLTSMDKIDTEVRRTALLSVGFMGVLLLSAMYFTELRQRHLERRESQRALEQTLGALKEKHAILQTVTEELRQASITDPLTGAFNRRFFMETAAKLVSAANRHGQPLSVIVVDVDHFKRINDEYGHPAGDKVLQILSALYRKELREGDIFARFGGEEFVLALPNTDEQSAQHVAERLREKLMHHPVEIDGQVFNVTVSSGVSRHLLDERTIEATIKRADDALYKAKNGGRNRVVIG